MAKYPGLTSRNGVWQVRKRIPADLEHIDTRGSRRVSLHTKDRREAIQKYPFILAGIEADFEGLRADLRSRSLIDASLATGRIEELGRSAVEELVRRWWEGRTPVRQPAWQDGQDVAEVLAVLEEDAHLLARAEGEGRDLAGEAVDRLLVHAGAASRSNRVGSIKTHIQYPIVNKDSVAYHRLRTLVRQGLEFEAMLARDYVTGDETTPSHPIFNPGGQDFEGGPTTVGQLINEFRAEREQRYDVESTARKYGLLFRVIGERWEPDLPVSKVTRKQCIELIGFIQKLPTNGTKKFPNLTLAQSIEAADAGNLKRLAPKSVGGYVQNLCAVLRWGKLQGYGVDVNTEGLKPTGGAEVQRRGMSPGELSTIFAALTSFREKAPHKFWVPALAAYTGARAGELCQLRTEDVAKVHGIACLNLTRFDPTGRAVAGKRFKNKQSERWVPLHRELLDAGFIAFANSCDGDGRLFPNLKSGKDGSHSHAFSKWFGRFMDGVGLSDPALVFHSFRHGFRDACRDADIPEETALALGGWATLNQGQRYGDRGAVPNLSRALAKIGYGDFRLSSLMNSPVASTLD